MHKKTLRFGLGFRVVSGNARSQAAEMVLPPGDFEGGPGNRHSGSDQWLFVLEGTGRATINDRKSPLRKGTLLFIEHGDRHEIRNTSRRPFKTW